MTDDDGPIQFVMVTHDRPRLEDAWIIAGSYLEYLSELVGDPVSDGFPIMWVMPSGKTLDVLAILEAWAYMTPERLAELKEEMGDE